MGEVDATLVVSTWGDNGASMEDTLTASFNELTIKHGIPLTPEPQLELGCGSCPVVDQLEGCLDAVS